MGYAGVGVSSFGISGTNAHVIIEQAPAGLESESIAAHRDKKDAKRDDRAWVLSARSERALANQAKGRLLARVASDPDLIPVDVGLVIGDDAVGIQSPGCGDRR